MNPIKLYGLIAVGIAFVLLAGTTVYLYRANEDLEERLAVAGQNLKDARDAADLCSEAVTRMETSAQQSALKFAGELEEARARADAKTTKAQRILRTPPSTPGNDCKSAGDRARAWLLERQK